MARSEREPRESGQRVVRLGEPFLMNMRPVDSQAREGNNYPHFFEEPIVVPELKLSGKLYLYADGSVMPKHVTPLGLIEFTAELLGSGVGFDPAGGELLMLSMILRGNQNIKGKRMVVETERGIYTAKSTRYEDINGHYCIAGTHTWDSDEYYPIFPDTESVRYMGKNVTAYFPRDLNRLRQAKIMIS